MSVAHSGNVNTAATHSVSFGDIKGLATTGNGVASNVGSLVGVEEITSSPAVSTKYNPSRIMIERMLFMASNNELPR